MAKSLIEIAIQLGSKLGANTSKFLGTRSNVNFLGSGPKDGMLFQKEINPESFATLGIEKVLPDIESSLAYAAGGKLDDFQLSRLIKNLKTMDETLNPTNVLEMGSVSKGLSDLDELNFTRDAVVAKRAIDNSPLEPGTGSSEFGRESYKNMDEFLKSRGDGGIDSLRAKSGIGERQVTEAVQDAKDAEGLAALRDRTGDNNVPLRTLDEIMKNPRKMADEAAFPGETFKATPAEQMNIRNQMKGMGVENLPAPAIMETVPKVDLPGKTASAREFLVNALKKENPNQTTFADIVDPVDIKFITEGGGGVDGDPIVLVQKYFGPRIAEMLPVNASSEEIAIFTNRVINNVVDAKGLKPSNPDFDNLTARFIDEFTPPGGGQPFAKGGLAKILEL